MEVSGRCHCGEISFRATVDPDKTRICHCVDCQHLSGAPFRAVVPVDEADFKLLTGVPKVYVKTAESGARRQQVFCGACGTSIYATSDDVGTRRFGLRVGALDQRRELVPKRQFWTRSALGWLGSLSRIDKFERQ